MEYAVRVLTCACHHTLKVTEEKKAAFQAQHAAKMQARGKAKSKAAMAAATEGREGVMAGTEGASGEAGTEAEARVPAVKKIAL